MTEVIKNSGIDKCNDYDSELAKINNDLSELKESILKWPENQENNDLPEWFEYDSDGCIICKNSSFTSEDYENHPTPIERVLWWKMKEREYRWIDYSGCDESTKHTILRAFHTRFFLLENVNWKIFIHWSESVPVILRDWVKILPPNCSYLKDIDNAWNTKLLSLIDDLNELEITILDIKNFFWEGVDESNVLKKLDTNRYDTINEEKKWQIFWEFSNKIGDISVISWLKRIKLKDKLWEDLFFKYVWEFVSKLDESKCIGEYNFFNWGAVDYLLSSFCKITLDNLDEYINYINGWWASYLWKYSIDDIKLIKSYGFDLDYLGMIDANWEFWKKLKWFENLWITYDMVKFSKTQVFDIPDVDIVEEFFIKEKEWINLFKFLCRYPQKLQNLWWKEIKELDLNTDKRNFCFRWILEMMKSRWDMEVLPYPWENANKADIKKWKKSWEKIIQEYEDFLRYYIWQDFDVNERWEDVEIDRKNTFDRIFYSMAVWKEDRNWVLRNSFDKPYLQEFSKNEILDYSSILDESWKLDQSNQSKLLVDVCNYAEQYPNEKILVYIWAHWGSDWSSDNGWNKNDWLKISKYPNVKVMSIRCFFWSAYSSEDDGSWDYIYDQQSKLSWFSNMETATTDINMRLKEWFEKWLWFHELELYARLKYDKPSPLTDEFEYRNRKTWKTEKKNVWLAYKLEENMYENNA